MAPLKGAGEKKLVNNRVWHATDWVTKGIPIRWRWQCQFESSILNEQSLCQKETTTPF